MKLHFAAMIAAVALAAPDPVGAAERAPPFAAKAVSINARGQDVRVFLADLFSQGGVRAKVSTAVTGKVNGVFVDQPARVWEQMARAYGLVGFYDGGVMRIYSQSEIASRSVAAASPDQVVGELRRMGLADGVNSARAGSGVVIATGVPEFLARVEEVAGGMRMRTAAVTPTTVPAVATPAITPVATGAIASPLLRSMPARATVRSVVTAAAGAASPFEVRMFFLKYRDAADRELSSTDRVTVVPGVATLLREQMGDGAGVSSASSNQYRLSDLDRSQEFIGDTSGPLPVDDPRARAPLGSGPESVITVDGARISADATNNAVIVRDRPERMGVYEQLIANLDTEPLMVEVEATIIDVNTNSLKELGVDWNLGIGGLRLLFGGEVQGGQGLPNVAGQYLSGNGDNFAVRIRALQQSGALRVVSRPILSTPSNQVAVFDDTTQQFARIVGEREVALKTITFGLSMRVKPSAIEDGGQMRIRMAIEISDTRLNGLVVDGIPLYSGPRISTQSIVKHGEAVLIAGMTSATQFDYKSKTPVLGDIPIAGQAFRKRNKGEQRMERLFLITPRIVSLGAPGRPTQPAVTPLSIEELQAGKRRTVKR